MLTHLVGRVCVCPGNKAKLSKYMGSGQVNISASIKASCTAFIWEFLRHIGTFVYHLGCVNTSMGRAAPPKTRPNWANTLGSMEVNISTSIKAPCTKYFLEVPETHRIISRSLGRCWHTCRQSASALNWAGLSKYLSFYEGPMHQILFGGSRDT